MAELAVKQLDNRSSESANLLAVFYTLLQAEILRPNCSDRLLKKRQEAKERSTAANSPMYDYYMSIERATEGELGDRDPPKKVRHGIARIREVRTGYWLWDTPKLEVESGERVVDPACEAVGVNEYGISTKDRYFLRRSNLKEVLALHGIGNAP